MEILPKIDGLDGEDAIRRSLLAMLAKTRDLEVRDSEAAGFLESAEPFICVLARLYGRRLFEAVRFGLRQEYVAHDELLPVLRGKVHWPSQAKRQAAQRLEFRCLFDERSADTPLNRTLKERLLALAKLLLGDRSPDLGRATTADRRSYAVVWDIRPLRGVRGARLPGRLRAEGPRRRPARRRAKWKRLDPRSGDLGVSGEDVYQVLAYAHRYATSSAVLIYPHHAALGRPGLQRDFVVQAGGGSRVVVRVATLDLARLERVAGEVREAVGAG